MKIVLNSLILLNLLLLNPDLAFALEDPETADAAILNLRAMETTDEKITYLLNETRKFMEESKYKDAVNVAKYILENLDTKSQESKNLLREAQIKLEEESMPQVNPVQVEF